MNTTRAKLWLRFVAEQEQRVLDGLELAHTMNRILKALITKQEERKDVQSQAR